MTLAPRTADIPKIPRALQFYRVMSFVTGTFLLLLCLEIITRYVIGYDLELGGQFGFLALVPHDQVTAVNLSTTILVIHGWLYVIYLIACFWLWSLMRWPFLRLIVLALGGIIPVLSFILEGIYSRRVRDYLSTAPAPEVPAA